MTKEELMRKAIELSRENVANGGGPFGAVIAKDGEIELYEINRGIKKSLDKMIKAIGTECKVGTPNLITISYVRNKERAEKIKEKIEELYADVKVHVRHTNGLSSGYADIGGIVIAF